jgi:hypothetical protein
MNPQTPQEPQEVTTFPQALQLLVDGVQVAQKRGAYSLQESSMLFKGISFLQKQAAQESQAQQSQKKLEKIEEM